MTKYKEVQGSWFKKCPESASALALHVWLSSFVHWRLKLPITVNITHFYWHNSDIYCWILYISVPLLATAYCTDISQFHKMQACKVKLLIQRIM